MFKKIILVVLCILIVGVIGFAGYGAYLNRNSDTGNENKQTFVEATEVPEPVSPSAISGSGVEEKEQGIETTTVSEYITTLKRNLINAKDIDLQDAANKKASFIELITSESDVNTIFDNEAFIRLGTSSQGVAIYTVACEFFATAPDVSFKNSIIDILANDTSWTKEDVLSTWDNAERAKNSNSGYSDESVSEHDSHATQPIVTEAPVQSDTERIIETPEPLN